MFPGRSRHRSARQALGLRGSLPRSRPRLRGRVNRARLSRVRLSLVRLNPDRANRARVNDLATGLLVPLLTLLAACATGATVRDLEPPRDVPAGLTPIEAFFTPGPLESPKLSPSGTAIAGFRELGDVANLVRLDLVSGRYSPITAFEDERLLDFWWVNDERLLLDIFRRSDRSRRLYAIDADGTDLLDFSQRRNQRDPQPLTAAPADSERLPSIASRGSRPTNRFSSDQILTRFTDTIVSIDPREPESVLVSYFYPTDPGEVASRVYRLNVESGRTTPVHRSSENPYRWISDPDGRVRLASSFDGKRSLILYRPDEQSPWIRIERSEPVETDRPSFQALGTATEPFKIYALSQHGGDRYALYLFDVRDQSFSAPLFEHPFADVSGPLVYAGPGASDPLELLGVHFVDDFERIHWFSEAWRSLDERLAQSLPDTQNLIVSRSGDDTKLLVLARSDRDAGSYLLFEPAENKLSLLARRRPALDPKQLAPVQPVSIRAGDGRELRGYLTLPPKSEAGRVPLVVVPHGGIFDRFPIDRGREIRSFWSRDTREWSGEVQFLASRGFAVLQVNFRGSTGLGNALESAGFGEWGGVMQQDLIDATRWLIEQGRVDPKRICSFGAGYGGYASVMALARAPELFRCGVAVAGVFDLPEQLAARRFQEEERPYRIRIAGGEVRAEQLRERSPIEQVGALRAPLLIVHGTEDQTVADTQARALAKALELANKPHDLLLFPDEPHGFSRSTTRIRFFRNLEAFLYRHL